MTKARLVLAGMLLSGAIFAQESSKISSAIIAYRNRGDVPAARELIDQADSIITAKGGADVSEKNMKKFYFQKGLIYQKYYQEVEKSLDVLNTSIDAYRDLIEYEKQIDDEDYTEDAQTSVRYLINQLPTFAYPLMNTDKDAAFAILERSYELNQLDFINVIDTATLYNMATLATSKEKQLEIFKELIDYGYTGISWSAIVDPDGKEGPEEGVRSTFQNKEQLDYYLEEGQAYDAEKTESVNPSLYGYAAFAARDLGDTAQFEAIIKQGRIAHPNDGKLLLYELQSYLDKKDYDGALANLETAAAEYPNEAVYPYNIGFIYHQEKGDKDKGLEYYNKAIASDSTYLDALYMGGVVYVERSNDVTNEMNELSVNQTTRYNELDAKRDELLREALVYFHKAEAVNPNDVGTLQSLGQVYFKLGVADKALEYNAKYKAAEAAAPAQP